MSTYRDAAAMWAAADDLYDENAAAKVAQAESNLSNLFGGRDFGSEVSHVIVIGVERRVFGRGALFWFAREGTTS